MAERPKQPWDWICEFCYRVLVNTPILLPEWDFVWQSAVCPECRHKVVADGGFYVVVGGAYANGPDPRETFTVHAHEVTR